VNHFIWYKTKPDKPEIPSLGAQEQLRKLLDEKN
jgi:hypothetical protein